MKKICLLILFISILPGRTVAGDLKDTTNRADYILIAPASSCAAAETLAAFRRAKNGLATMVVELDTIYAQFGGGTTPDTALKSFVQYSLSNWSDPKPQFFVLAGNTDAIPSHPEPETLINAGATVFDSTLMIDQWFIEQMDSTGLPHTRGCIARFPAWDSSALSTMIAKTIEYENDTTTAWTKRVISLADFDSLDGGFVFESDAAQLRSLFCTVWSDTIPVDIRASSPNHIDTMSFLKLWDAGAAIISYCGHANQVVLSATDYFTTSDVDSLTNGNRLPVCLFGGCDLTYDTRPPLSIPTHLLQKSNGGAVAVISSEGLNYEWQTYMFYAAMVDSLIAKREQPIGPVFEEAKPDAYWYEMTKRFTLLGDPALVIKHPSAATAVPVRHAQPSSFVLAQNYPNPFNPSTVISYQLSVNGRVTLMVYDLLGREVAKLVDEEKRPGSYRVVFDGSRLASGVYFYRLTASGFTETKKLMLLK